MKFLNQLTRSTLAAVVAAVEGTAAAASTVVVEVIREVVDLIRGRFIPVPAFIRGRFIPVPAFIRDHFNSAFYGGVLSRFSGARDRSLYPLAQVAADGAANPAVGGGAIGVVR